VIANVAAIAIVLLLLTQDYINVTTANVCQQALHGLERFQPLTCPAPSAASMSCNAKGSEANKRRRLWRESLRCVPSVALPMTKPMYATEQPAHAEEEHHRGIPVLRHQLLQHS
jgi:hypothetical protein